MKQLIITALTITLIASEGISQTSNDTICLPSSQLKKAINRIETCKVIEEELTITKESLQTANQRLTLKDSIITSFRLQTAKYTRLIDNYTQNVTSLENINSNLKKEVSLHQKIIRRQKLSKWLVGGIGLGLGILISK